MALRKEGELVSCTDLRILAIKLGVLIHQQERRLLQGLTALAQILGNPLSFWLR